MKTQDEASAQAAARAGKLRETVRTSGRFLRYLGIRTIIVLLTVMVGVYAAIWVTNLGGYADEFRRREIRSELVLALGPAYLSSLPPSEREAALETALEGAYRAADLDRPFFIRSFGYFRDAFSLSLGRTRYMRTFSGSNVVLDLLMEKLPVTLLLFGVASVISFVGGLVIALGLSRRYGSLVDRATTLLVPALAAPPWFHGLFLIVIFASVAKLLPFGGIVAAPPPQTSIGYALSVAKHMILPVTACVLGTLPFAVYANRALFLLHSNEDYVELAEAKGLRQQRLLRRYVLRPVLPPIITNFALVSIVSWQGVILTEYVFAWPGLGRLLIEAMQATAMHPQETGVVIGAVTMFAFLLGANVLLLDLLYVLADPRIALAAKGRG